MTNDETLLKLTEAMRALGVANFKYGDSHVAFWQPHASPVSSLLASIDPGPNPTNQDLFGDAEDPDAGLPK